ncbi:segregation/condensation protein A [Streptomyces sp. NPDC096176]|uniref:segregation and condensation protein A n=1 Tax=Streptomyces sp. NPDC096176 TaxID=3366079 RepID=UPI0037F8497F
MPPNDDPPRPSRRRALGRGPGTSPPAETAPAPGGPVGTGTGGEPVGREERACGGEPVGPEDRALRDGERGAEAVPAPAPVAAPGEPSSPAHRALRDGVPSTAAEADVAGAGDRACGGEPVGPEDRALRDGDGGAEAVLAPAADAGSAGAEGGVEAVSALTPVAAPGEPSSPAHHALRDGGAAAPASGAGATDAEDASSGGTREPDAPGGGSPEGDGRFTVRLANFEGPFDLLLQLISRHKLDVTEVALSRVTDEFMAYIRAMGPDWDLDQTTEFLVVAATLLDLKAARLLPAAEVEDEADLALLEARDLLFARLLQYRAYKQIAEIFDGRLDEEARRFPRTVGLEPHHAELLPDVVISIGAEGFAKLAVKAMQPKPKPQVYVDHIHAPLVSVREQAEVVVGLLRERGRATFRELTEGVDDTLTVVARFLALLELYREKAVALDQGEALGELTVVWAGAEAESVTVTDEFDQVVEEKP